MGTEAGTFLITKQELPSDAPALAYRTAPQMNTKHHSGVRFGTEVKGELANGWLKVQLEEKQARRLEDGKTVNDVLNKHIVEELTKLQKIVSEKGWPPEGSDFYEW